MGKTIEDIRNLAFSGGGISAPLKEEHFNKLCKIAFAKKEISGFDKIGPVYDRLALVISKEKITVRKATPEDEDILTLGDYCRYKCDTENCQITIAGDDETLEQFMKRSTWKFDKVKFQSTCVSCGSKNVVRTLGFKEPLDIITCNKCGFVLKMPSVMG